MKIKRNSRIAAYLIGWVFIFTLVCDVRAGEVLIIANPDVPADALNKDEIKNFFLGKTPQWSNQDMVTIVISEDAAVHKKFLKGYIRRTSAQFTNVWRNNLFSGKGKQPIKAASIDELVEYVSKTKGAIGYIPSESTPPSKVKVLSK